MGKFSILALIALYIQVDGYIEVERYPGTLKEWGTVILLICIFVFGFLSVLEDVE